jgi:hypothetical protein
MRQFLVITQLAATNPATRALDIAHTSTVVNVEGDGEIRDWCPHIDHIEREHSIDSVKATVVSGKELPR